MVFLPVANSSVEPVVLPAGFVAASMDTDVALDVSDLEASPSYVPTVASCPFESYFEAIIYGVTSLNQIRKSF